ncbi:MAG: VCBS repeat-containing protein, partial [Saprospiraceae bacterium]
MNLDTNLCYIKEEYPSTIFAIEKKMVSEEDVRISLTPLLVDFDRDCISEIVVTGNEADNQLCVIDPISGKTIKKIATYFNLGSASSYAIADVDNDGHIEIVMAIAWYQTMPASIRGKLICFDIDGNLKWVSDQRFDNGHLYKLGGAPAFADFNQDGIPEVYIHNVIYNAQNGIKIADGGINGIGAGGELNPEPSVTLSIAAQLDDNIADLELAAGYTVYKISITNPNGMTGNSMIPNNLLLDNEFRDGFTSVADINLDGKLDIIVASPGINNAKLYAYSMNNGLPVLLAKSTLSSGTFHYIGPPIIADVNGSGIMSIIVNSPNQLQSFNYNGSITFTKEWSMTVFDNSGYTGLTIFDLNNDGKKEIIYRDESDLRIINVDLNVPKELARISCPAPSREENPIVGGIDSSGHARICVICKNIDSTGGKLYIFGPPDSLPGWAPARGIWNQYNYHVLNINDDLTVPRVQKNNATYKNGKYNNFFVQESLLDSNGMYLKRAASLTGKIKCINYDPKNDEYTVIFDIYNRTDASFNADSSMPVSFYNGDPATGGILIGTYYTLKKLFSGDSLLNLEFKFTVANLTDLFMVINTKRNASGQFDPSDFSIAECDYTDNILRTLKLPRIEKLNASICKGDTYNFFDTLLNDAGMYYHKLSSVNGCDSLIFNLELTLVDTVHTMQSIIACDRYSWNGTTYTQSGRFIYDTINQFG